jgi:hypothetical protein
MKATVIAGHAREGGHPVLPGIAMEHGASEC